MARPKKWRRVCMLPEIVKFGPIDLVETLNESIIMTVEEYETIRLIDLEGLNQEQSANVMGVARSTLQRTYDDARRKLADSLVNGKLLKIEGGNYKLCSELEDEENCDNCICHRHRHGRNMKPGR
ncbi:DUF134 domain-containing protein [Clostridium frigoris]|uniref:UPF0251 protein KPL37_13340 n=1 Tax=Clostridium frigoris TaxID=205327 RepID=A0ABS6BUZ1_9CLOT|nr:DUF134 domain-containing protein [Clostridium frigoris]MBU3160728.1 DUF134 domain-containing protein [Clostridium frigoris]